MGKQIKAMFAKDIQSIDQLIAKNQMNHSSASPNLQFMIPSSNTNTNTQQNQVLNQLSNEQILQLLQQSIKYELNNQNLRQSNGAKNGDTLSDNSDTTNSLDSNPLLVQQQKKQSVAIKAEKAYKCLVCDKRFDRKSALSVHALTHCGSKCFECRVCHKKFSLQSEYLYHVNHKHNH